ncbi:hypothetical protein [Streptomyces sp. Tu 2975]|uniref:hypothetical protein n=1 Tax=Streptomyces sp. Tu 2975 TaxID=2676871 RepID=UPI001ABDCD05|nr:hypothetical protein [Streptomyces sp. Tu 2975]
MPEPGADNVYAGLAGLYFVRDPADERLGLQQGVFEVPLILQDRTFHKDGSLAYYEKWLDGGRRPEDRPVLANHLTGPPIPPDPDEARSYKDTVKSYPETVTRIITQEFSPPTGTIASIPDSGTELPATYIHHCHILEHEDDDLMRPWTIVGHDGGDHDGGDHDGHGK